MGNFHTVFNNTVLSRAVLSIRSLKSGRNRLHMASGTFFGFHKLCFTF